MNIHLMKVFWIFLLLVLTGCARCPECGSLQQRNEITILFNNEELVEGYSYYYNGRSSAPTAILGLDEKYTLQGQFWTAIDLTQEQLSTWVRAIQTTRKRERGQFRGAEILNPNGERAGIWFSNFDWVTTRFLEENVVEVFAPAVRPGAGSNARNREFR